uniref:Protein FAM89A n=1 Tax=Neolamprologus brichardi TaxID=32507 RepID=A0A3Q4G2S2_NEOBR
MNGKSTNGTLGGMACIEGLPPLPKSLSGLLNSSGGSWREMERMYVKKTMIQDDLSRGRNNADNLLANKPANLDAALALLRKEMVTFSECFPLFVDRKVVLKLLLHTVLHSLASSKDFHTMTRPDFIIEVDSQQSWLMLNNSLFSYMKSRS